MLHKLHCPFPLVTFYLFCMMVWSDKNCVGSFETGSGEIRNICRKQPSFSPFSVFVVFEGNVGATLQQKVNSLPRSFRRRKQQWRPLLGVYRIDFYPLTSQSKKH